MQGIFRESADFCEIPGHARNFREFCENWLVFENFLFYSPMNGPNVSPIDNCKSFRFVMPGTPLAKTRQLGNHVKEPVQYGAMAVENATTGEIEDDSDAETRPLLGHNTRQFPPTRV